jgi:hypothetical protein
MQVATIMTKWKGVNLSGIVGQAAPERQVVEKNDCGNKENMCYCDCSSFSDGTPDNWSCQQTELGWKWNNGIKNADGSYALNGTKGDGKQYVC